MPDPVLPEIAVSAVVLQLLGLFLALFVYSFFILAFTAITRSRSTRIRELARRGYPGTVYARLILSQAESHLLSAQTGAFLAALFAGLTTDALLNAPFLEAVANAIPQAGQIEGFVVALGFVGLVALIGLSLVQVAKAVAFARPNRALCMVSVPMLAATRVLWPVVWFLKSTVGKGLSALGLSIPIERELAVSPEEINEIVEMSSKAGQIEDDEREMIRHVFTFSDTITREVMTPRKDIVSVPEAATLSELVAIFTQERISRVLVTGNDLDDVKGVLLAKDLLPLVGKSDPQFNVRRFLRPAVFVPNTKKVDDLLAEFRRDAVHFAVVLDEHGGVDGVVTVEDLVEEIVGEIFDEFDSPIEDVDVQRTKTGELIVDGSTIIDDLNTEHALGIPRGHYDTIAGFVISTLGRIPKVGEMVRWDGHQIRVEEVLQNRVTSVRISSEPRNHQGVRSSGPQAGVGQENEAPSEGSKPPEPARAVTQKYQF